MAKAYVVVWSELVYAIWLSRWKKIFQRVRLDVDQLVKSILFTVASRMDYHVGQFLLM